MIAALILLGCGLLVGGSVAGVLTVLNLPGRICGRLGAERFRFLPGSAILSGATVATILDIGQLSLCAGQWFQAILYISAGTFAGMLISAITEIVKVLPASMAQLKLSKVAYPLIGSIALGKIAGTVLYFLWING